MPSLLADNLDYLDKDKYYNRQWVVTPQEAYDFTKGRAVGIPAGLLDVAGMMQGAGNPYTGQPLYPKGVPQQRISGDPVRDYYGTNNPAGLLGEFFDPVGRVAKVAKGVGGLLQSAPDIAKAVGEGGLLNYAMTLFHGTPHKFDVFDLKKIGTGEGAQAYGHGLYFAESPGVAKSYAMNLAGGKTLPKKWTGEGVSKIRDRYGLTEEQTSQLFDVAESSIDDLGDEVFSTAKDGTPFADALDEISMNRAYRGEPHLYEVDIPDETIGKMLDWDAKMGEQDGIAKVLNANWDKLPEQARRNAWAQTGKEWYKSVASEYLPQAKAEGLAGKAAQDRAEQLASMQLNELGIPGIRYYDAQSRVTGRPRKAIIKSFLDELPEDAEFDDLAELVGTGHFTKEQDAVLRALEKDDWLGFDYPSQAINEAFGPNLKNWEPSAELTKAIKDVVDPGATRNIVVFNPDDIKSVKRDGELVYKAGR